MWLDGNLCNKYIRTPPTHYFIKSSGQSGCMEIILSMTTTELNMGPRYQLNTILILKNVMEYDNIYIYIHGIV